MINQERLFKTLYDLLSINSPSGQEKAVAEYIIDKFTKLGLDVEKDDTSAITKANTGNVIAVLKGKTSERSILFNAHMDTIQPTDALRIVEDDGRIKSDSTTILGADNKTGIAVILEMVESIIENGIEHVNLEIVFTVSEEIGLIGANAIDLSGLKSRIGFCFDGGGPAGLMIMQSPSQEVMELNFKGKAVHAGIEPEKGANAIYAAAKAASRFPQGRIDDKTTANLGEIHGGSATNVVAEDASLKIEVRSQSRQKLEEVVSQIEQQAREAAVETNTQVSVKRKKAFEGFMMKEDEPVIRIAAEAMENIGLEPGYSISGGGSDANVFNGKGVRTATLSMGSRLAHSNDEFVDKKELVKVAELAVEIVKVASSAKVK